MAARPPRLKLMVRIHDGEPQIVTLKSKHFSSRLSSQVLENVVRIQDGTACLYAARMVSARLIHLAMSVAVAPMVRSDRMIKSSDTERSAASILATRD